MQLTWILPQKDALKNIKFNCFSFDNFFRQNGSWEMNLEVNSGSKHMSHQLTFFSFCRKTFNNNQHNSSQPNWNQIYFVCFAIFSSRVSVLSIIKNISLFHYALKKSKHNIAQGGKKKDRSKSRHTSVGMCLENEAILAIL